MRDVLKWSAKLCFLALLLFSAPNCAFNTHGQADGNPPCEGEECPPKPCESPDPACTPPDCDPNDPNDPDCPPPDPVKVFHPGIEPTSAILCEYPLPVPDDLDTCATQEDLDDGTNISLSQAATALATGQSKSFALDFSLAATSKCPGGFPKKIKFLSGTFPEGDTVCLNCETQLPKYDNNPTAVCVAKCTDLVNFGGVFIPAQGAAAYCAANARTATNYDSKTCIGGVCTIGGSPILNWPDPRRVPEPVEWTDLIEANANGNTVKRTLPTMGITPQDFKAGAASTQLITKGDAWVEFQTNNTTLTQVLGVRESCSDPVNVCPDTNSLLDDIGFAIDLASDGNVYLFESSPIPLGQFGPYMAGERFRLKVVDNHDGKATLSAWRVSAGCMPGTPCTVVFIAESAVKPTYPLRVNVSFREFDATLVDVNIVRIK